MTNDVLLLSPQGENQFDLSAGAIQFLGNFLARSALVGQGVNECVARVEDRLVGGTGDGQLRCRRC